MVHRISLSAGHTGTGTVEELRVRGRLYGGERLHASIKKKRKGQLLPCAGVSVWRRGTGGLDAAEHALRSSLWVRLHHVLFPVPLRSLLSEEFHGVLFYGHIEALKEIGGVANRHTYDNLKSVVITRKPEITYNARFLDFARHYGFSIRACNPGKPNEKGRVERVIRDIESFLVVNTFADIDDLNKRLGLWRIQRNSRIHRSTGTPPVEALKQEKLIALPQIHYLPYRQTPAAVTKTCFVEFDTNRYSVPSQHGDMPCDIFAYPQYIEIAVQGRKVATHKRVFDRKQKMEHPSHRERLLNITPHFKYQRMYQLLKSMDKSIEHFLIRAEQERQDTLEVSYQLFKLLKGIAKETLISAVKSANSIDTYRVSYIQGLLSPAGYQDNPVHPQNEGLLHITYEGRQLSDYDQLI